MKKCSKCFEEKPEDEFAWKKRDVRRASNCKTCQNSMAKEHYEQNKQYYKDKSKVSRPILRARGKQLVIEYLQSHPCVDCGETDIEVLEFDHIVPLGNWRQSRVTSLIESSEKRILEEIAKCEVRCANCHTRRTRRMTGTLRMPV